MLTTVLGKGLSFFRTALCAAIFGASAQTDAFYMGVGVLTVLAAPASVFTTVIVPARAGILAGEGRGAADRFTSSLLNFSVLLCGVLFALALIFMPAIVRVFAPSFQGEVYDQTVRIGRVFSPLIAVNGAVFFLVGILNTHHRYVVGNLVGIALNAGWVAVPLLLAERWGMRAMIGGYLLGSVLQIAVLLPGLRGVFRYRFELRFRHPQIRETLRMCATVFIGVCAYQINQAVDKAIASSLADGSVSALGYASQLTSLVQGILIMPIVTSAFTALSALAQKKDMDSYKGMIVRVMNILALCVLPVMALFLIYPGEIVTVVYQRGAFDAAAHGMTQSSFYYYAMGLLPIALSVALTRCFYTLSDARTPLYINLTGLGVNVALSLSLSRALGIGGIALATSVSYAVTLAATLFCLRRKIGAMGLSRHVRDLGKMAAALAALLAAALLVKRVPLSAIASVFLGSLAGGAAYVMALAALRQSELADFFAMVKNAASRRLKGVSPGRE
jgi:putative peptidoglycan lipid II flippase